MQINVNGHWHPKTANDYGLLAKWLACKAAVAETSLETNGYVYKQLYDSEAEAREELENHIKEQA